MLNFWLEKIFYQKWGWLHFLLLWPLLPLSLVMRVYMKLRRQHLTAKCYNISCREKNSANDNQVVSNKRQRQVISVGSLVVGGAGKSPVSLYLAERLLSQGQQVYILFRGYRAFPLPKIAKRWQARIITTKELDDKICDEALQALMLLPEVKVGIGRNRTVLLEQIYSKNQNSDRVVVILDDGFQTLKVKRVADLVVFNTRQKLGNGFCLPAGPMREGLEALNAAQILWFNQPSQQQALSASFMDQIAPYADPQSILVQSRFVVQGFWFWQEERLLSLEALKGKRVFGWAGCAHPQNVKSLLLECGARVIGFNGFPDHYYFNSSQIVDMALKAKNNRCDYMVTTDKDIARLWHLVEGLEMPLLSLRLKIEIFSGQHPLDDWLRHYGVGPGCEG